jgi:hypothetical protein
MEAHAKPAITARNPLVVPKQRRVEPLLGMRFVSCAMNPKDTIGTWSSFSRLIRKHLSLADIGGLRNDLIPGRVNCCPAESLSDGIVGSHYDVIQACVELL